MMRRTVAADVAPRSRAFPVHVWLRILRFALRGDPTFGYLEHRLLPAGVLNQNNHMSYDVDKARIVDNYEGHAITVDNEGQHTSQLGALVADIFRFAQGGGSFNTSFFGNTNGNVSRCKEGTGQFREPLKKPADLTKSEIRVRAAEVFQSSIPAQPTGFRVGAEDTVGTVAWVDVDDVGGLPRPFDRSARDWKTKTMLATFRFPGQLFQGGCFAAEPASDPGNPPRAQSGRSPADRIRRCRDRRIGRKSRYGLRRSSSHGSTPAPDLQRLPDILEVHIRWRRSISRAA